MTDRIFDSSNFPHHHHISHPLIPCSTPPRHSKTHTHTSLKNSLPTLPVPATGKASVSLSGGRWGGEKGGGPGEGGKLPSRRPKYRAGYRAPHCVRPAATPQRRRDVGRSALGERAHAPGPPLNRHHIYSNKISRLDCIGRRTVRVDVSRAPPVPPLASLTPPPPPPVSTLPVRWAFRRRSGLIWMPAVT